MSYYKMTVDCYYQLKINSKRKRITRNILCEADSYTLGKTIALNYAEKTAIFGPLWVGFECISGVRVTLPVEVL